MLYSTPELVVLGSAAVLVQGGIEGLFDHGDPTAVERPEMGVVLGLDA